MRKSVFYSLKTFTQGRLPSADASTGSISYKVDGSSAAFLFVSIRTKCAKFELLSNSLYLLGI